MGYVHHTAHVARAQQTPAGPPPADDSSPPPPMQLLRAVVGNASSEFKMVGAVALVAGIPNVGKSTLINAMREQHRGTVGGKKSRGEWRVVPVAGGGRVLR